MDEKTQRGTFDISGMHCAACARRIERRMHKTAGVLQVQVNLATERMDVSYDGEVIDEVGISRVVEQAGFGAELRGAIIESAFTIGGMSCAACVRRVQRALESVEGVQSAEVNLATETVRVRYNRTEAKRRALYEAVERAGYSFGRKEVGAARTREKDAVLSEMGRSLATALLFWLPLFALEMGSMAGVPVPKALSIDTYPLRVGGIHLALAVPVMWIARSMYVEGSCALVRGGPNMFTLIAIGTAAAFFYSVAGLAAVLWDFSPSFFSYFPAVSTILTLVLLGRYLEARSRASAGESMRALLSLRPSQALLIDDGDERTVDVDEIEVGDLLRVRPGEALPADGQVVDGLSEVDESLLTGESLPVTKAPGDQVMGGSSNGSGALVIRATRVGEASLIDQMQRLVEEAQLGRAPIARLADVVSGYFVPFVITVATLSAFGWYMAGAEPAFAIGVFVSVLIIACPCSLGLATPAAIMVGTGRGAQLGILIKTPEALEEMQRLDAVVLDKTGTVTAGTPSVVRVKSIDPYSEEEVLCLAASVERYSEHPLALAITERTREDGIALLAASAFLAEVGQGACAAVRGQQIRVGTASYIERDGVAVDRRLEHGARTCVWVACDGRVVGLIELADPVRLSSREGVQRLRALGLDVIMLSGDRSAVVRDVAQCVGIETMHAEVLPADKVDVIKVLQEAGQRVAMVGDGINDAPALAQANVGMAVASGVDVAASASDIVLMHSRVEDIARAVELGRATMRTIKQNLFWAFFYNAAGIPVAAGLLYLFGGPLLNPMLASVAMAFSSVSVVSNALRLRRFAARA
ncbi:MAG: heavy metal translocating P-type ATPase [Gemmatimonadetes bacterium]|nr:heavy metal translocating P-type ATPase [Gemmatimonadota bacterium]|tara:strand:- start:5742 stop:8180 length:2439 start_codon:yes stop_codon:yes gene_type:complete